MQHSYDAQVAAGSKKIFIVPTCTSPQKTPAEVCGEDLMRRYASYKDELCARHGEDTNLVANFELAFELLEQGECFFDDAWTALVKDGC